MSITNNSNFAIDATAEVSSDFTLDETGASGITAAGGTGGFTITPKAGITSATTGTATFTFIKNGGLVQYNNNAATDTTAGT